jgi:DHHC palmitoyltransferase
MIYRMCHHCVWLNQCVGVKEHAAFLTFVVVHWLQIALWLALSLFAWSKEVMTATHKHYNLNLYLHIMGSLADSM